MKNKKSMLCKRLCVFLILTLMVAIVPASLFVQNAEASAYSPFHDVSPNYWALPHIVKMESRGIILGTGGGVFDPENTVTQLQAITMAVRAMGLENLTHNTETFVDTSHLDLPTTWNARGYTSVAISKELVDSLTFRPNAGASRAWVAQLLIRMIGANDELINTATTSFNDDEIIPVWAKPSVALAVEKGLITGVASASGGFDYLPNNAVKRSELATLISRADRYMQNVEGQLPVGQITDTSETSITLIQSDNTTEIFDIADITLLYDSTFKRIPSSSLTKDDLIRYAFKDGSLLYVEVLNADHYEKFATTDYMNMSGTIIQHFQTDRLLTIRDSENRLHTHRYGGTVIVKQNSSGDTIPVSNLQLGALVDLKIEDGTITEIQLQNTSSVVQPNTEGIVFDIDIPNRILTLEQNGVYVPYDFSEAVKVEYGSMQFPTVRDLEIGDIVEIVVENNLIVTVKLVTSNKDYLLQGTVVALSPTEQIMTIRSGDKQLQAYQGTEFTKYTILGVSSPTFTDLQVGDEIVFTSENQMIVTVEVRNRSYHNNIKGSVISVDTNLRLLIIQDDSNEFKTFKLAEDVVLNIGRINPTISDIPRDEIVVIQLDKNIVQEVTLRNRFVGEIRKIDTSTSLVTIQTEYGLETYGVSSTLFIGASDKLIPALKDLQVGEEAILQLSQNKITYIFIKSVITSEVTKVELTTNRVYIKEGDALMTYHTLYSGVTIVIPGISNPTLSDIPVGAGITLYYDGYELKKIEIQP